MINHSTTDTLQMRLTRRRRRRSKMLIMPTAVSEKSQKILAMVEAILKGKEPKHPAGSLAQALLNLPINKSAKKLPVKPK